MKLDQPIAQAGGVYKRFASRLNKLNIYTFADFLYHIPNRYEDYSHVSRISEVTAGTTVSIRGTVLSAKNAYTRLGKTLQQVIITDGSGTIEVTWFNQPYLMTILKTNSDISLAGRVERSGSKLIMQSPEYEKLTNEQTETIHTGRLVPIYPETRGISSKWLRRQVYGLLKNVSLQDMLPSQLQGEYHLETISQAMQHIHFPQTYEQTVTAKQRLMFEELFLLHLQSMHRRNLWKTQTTTQALSIDAHKLDQFLRTLPFSLTDSQQRALEIIIQDLQKDKPMNRLLQGDVGSGKTVVAAIAMFIAATNGTQGVLMAPTEILAEQHYKTISNLLSPFGMQTKLVTGSNKAVNDDDKTDVFVGTHALMYNNANFLQAGIVVIDEQQRFGVEQRARIREKGNNPHVLTMTATPIPRTMALTVYGDLDVSYLEEVPSGRKRIKTWLVPPIKREAAYSWIKKQIIATDSQAFILCPFIEKSETMQTVKAATVEYDRLQKDVFPDLSLGLLHGKMKSKEKEQVLSDFRNRTYDILVTTPVVEVGIDIPNATIMLIEASERFGLSQLHQLRGRVGRGEKQSFCLLFTESQNAQATKRLKSLETMHNGNQLAELDLQLRGSGSLYGTLQSGYTFLKFASFSDTHLIETTRTAARNIYINLDNYPLLKQWLLIQSKQNIAAN